LFAALQYIEARRASQLTPHLGKEVTHEAEMVCEVRRVELRHIPAGQVRMDAIHESRVVTHLFRERREEMPHAQLLVNVDVEVADHDDPALGSDRLATAAEFPGLHVALEDVDAFLLVERDAGDLVEADHVVLGDEAAAPAGHVHEHVGDRRLAARDEVGVWRDLLEEVRLPGAARTQLDGVVVPHDEGDHSQEKDVLLARS